MGGEAAEVRRLPHREKRGRRETDGDTGREQKAAGAVRPGDVIVADGDGVIAVPRCAAEEVAFCASRELRNDKANRKAKYAVLGWAPDNTMKED